MNGVWLRVAPSQAVPRVRAAVRSGIAEVWGAADVSASEGEFTPHVSLVYSNTDGPDDPYAAAGPRSATVEFAAIQAISLSRHTHLYRWETVASVPLGSWAIRGNPLGLSVVIKGANRSR
jgi:2'-5' RNA ligase